MRTLLALGFAALALGASGGPPDRYGVEPESRFWIDGSTAAGGFTCAARDVDGAGTVNGASAAHVAGRVLVPVRAFDCGNRRMNADFAKALKGGAHPSIRFEIHSARVTGPGAAGWTRATATGSLEVAGVRRPVTVDVDGQTAPDGRVHLRGRMPMRMSDFNVHPPTGLFGLVRAHDRIAVRFSVVVARDGPAEPVVTGRRP